MLIGKSLRQGTAQRYKCFGMATTVALSRLCTNIFLSSLSVLSGNWILSIQRLLPVIWDNYSKLLGATWYAPRLNSTAGRRHFKICIKPSMGLKSGQQRSLARTNTGSGTALSRVWTYSKWSLRGCIALKISRRKKPPTDGTADGVALSHSQVKCTVSW